MWNYLIPSTKKNISFLSVEMIVSSSGVKMHVGIHKHNGTSKYFKERPPCIKIIEYEKWITKPQRRNRNEND